MESDKATLSAAQTATGIHRLVELSTPANCGLPFAAAPGVAGAHVQFTEDALVSLGSESLAALVMTGAAVADETGLSLAPPLCPAAAPQIVLRSAVDPQRVDIVGRQTIVPSSKQPLVRFWEDEVTGQLLQLNRGLLVLCAADDVAKFRECGLAAAPMGMLPHDKAGWQRLAKAFTAAEERLGSNPDQRVPDNYTQSALLHGDAEKLDFFNECRANSGKHQSLPLTAVVARRRIFGGAQVDEQAFRRAVEQVHFAECALPAKLPPIGVWDPTDNEIATLSRLLASSGREQFLRAVVCNIAGSSYWPSKYLPDLAADPGTGYLATQDALARGLANDSLDEEEIDELEAAYESQVQRVVDAATAQALAAEGQEQQRLLLLNHELELLLQTAPRRKALLRIASRRGLTDQLTAELREHDRAVKRYISLSRPQRPR